MTLTIIVFAIYVLLVFNFIGPEQALGELQLRVVAIGAVILPYPLVFAFRMFTTIPDRELSAHGEIDKLNARLTPNLRFSLMNNGQPIAVPEGSVTKTAAGYVTNQKGENHYICASVENTSHTFLGAEITLASLKGQHG